MIKQHTAQSLSKYLGQRVHCKLGDFNIPPTIGTLISIKMNKNERIQKEVLEVIPLKSSSIEKIVLSPGFYSGDYWSDGISKGVLVYPILKTYEKLIEPMEFEGKTIVPIEFIALRYWIQCCNRPIEDFKLTSKKEELLETGLENLEPYKKFTYFKFGNFEIFLSEDFVFGEPKSVFNQIQFNTNYDGVEALMELGFGAIENKESPTGYVDLWNYPCYAI